ncbi:innexin unc-9-like [Mercenaria mercenaria]|uniref:innexin unc-9-like n=1 Tax=Mercenaria mercenaria TaxID=6596 RepID=UPI00234ECE53|nr:innexin unc-9-like [Mercenaria mercenaria]
MVLKHIGPFSSLHAKFKESCRTDDWSDRMNHLYTACLLLCFAILVSTAQFVGENRIKCWVPAELKDFHEKYTNDYCWISNTYYIPMLESIPTDIPKRQEAEITYYQWVPLILAFQAFLFHFPNFIWNVLNLNSGLNLGKIRALADQTQCGDPKEREKVVENISKLLQRWIEIQRQYKHNFVARAKARFSHVFCFYCNKREGNFLTGLYLCTKVLYIANVIGQFFMLNSFLSTDFGMYGFEYIRMMRDGVPMRESPRFPRITLCDMDIRQLQNIQRWTVQCVLPINLFNEKIFIFLWFWFFILAIFTGLSFIRWVYLIVIKKNNYQYVKKYLTLTKKMNSESDKQLCRRFAEDYLRNDGCFVARTIGKNSTEMVVMDVLEYMWRDYKQKDERKHPENSFT